MTGDPAAKPARTRLTSSTASLVARFTQSHASFSQSALTPPTAKIIFSKKILILVRLPNVFIQLQLMQQLQQLHQLQQAWSSGVGGDSLV